MELRKIRQQIRGVSFLGVLMVCSCLLLGWADDLDGIKENVAFVTSVQASFVQEKHLEILDDPLISRGVLYFAAPYSLRWEYQHPVRSVLLMDNENIRQYSQAGSEMVAQKNRELEVMRVFLREICMWMQGEFSANPDLDAEVMPGGMVLLKPDKNSAMAQVIQRIELRLTNDPGVIESVTIYEDETSHTTILFHDTTINRHIKRDVFQTLNPDE